MASKVDLHEQPLPPRAPGRKKPKGNEPDFDLRTHLYRICGVDFTQIEGLQVVTVQTIVAEVGLDPSRFPSQKRFTSWLGLCPDNRITGGKVKSARTRRVNNRAADAFRLAAQALANSQGPIGTFYRRLRARLGAAEANTATAHKLARIFYRLWSNPAAYDPDLIQAQQNRNQQRTINYLRKKARSFGFDLVPQPAAGL